MTTGTGAIKVRGKADCIVGVYWDWWVYNAKCIVGIYSDWVYNAKCIVRTAHIVFPGNHDNSDTRVVSERLEHCSAA